MPHQIRPKHNAEIRRSHPILIREIRNLCEELHHSRQNRSRVRVEILNHRSECEKIKGGRLSFSGRGRETGGWCIGGFANNWLVNRRRNDGFRCLDEVELIKRRALLVSEGSSLSLPSFVSFLPLKFVSSLLSLFFPLSFSSFSFLLSICLCLCLYLQCTSNLISAARCCEL